MTGRRRLTDLRLVRTQVGGYGLERIANTEALGSLRSLTIRAAVGYDAELRNRVAWSNTLAGVRGSTPARGSRPRR